MAPNGQIQSEYYAQDESLSMEGRLATFYPPTGNPENLDSSKQRNEFYSSLSDDTRQDGNTVYENIKFTVNDLHRRGPISQNALKIIMDTVDGCAVQYRSGTVL